MVYIRCVAAHDIAKRLEYKYGYDDTTSSCATDSRLLRKALEEVIFGILISECDDMENKMVMVEQLNWTRMGTLLLI